MKFYINFLITFFLGFFLFFIFGNFSNILAEDANLAPNPSFEYGIDTPSDWETSNSSSCNDSQETPALKFESLNWLSKTGSRSLSLQDIDWYDPNNYWMPGYWISSNFIYVRYNPNRYKIGGWVYSSENNLYPTFLICTFDVNGNLRRQTRLTSSLTLSPRIWTWIELSTINFVGKEKIKIALGANCSYVSPSSPCQGYIAFDDIMIRPIGTIIGHKFEDVNNNKILDLGETSLANWEMLLFPQPDCTGNWRESGWTNADGNKIFTGGRNPYAPGSYSILETFRVKNKIDPPPYSFDARDQGWINTTPVCQNVTLAEGETPVVNFGNVQESTFPYFSQKNPQWAQDEYDHANSIGPFFCGTTIGGCGCAVTSSAMILQYHGAEKSPTGEITNPQTLNNWLKVNNGYAFGALKWPSVASYAYFANQNFGTQKIKFTGIGSANDFNSLDSELNSQRPVILQEPGHFIVASGTQNPTYQINDPVWENNKTLNSYGNNFTSMRKFAKTSTDLSTLYISTPSPNQIFLIDSQGRRVGKDPQTETIYNEIPNSFYFLESTLIDQNQNNPPQPPENTGVQTLAIINPSNEQFQITIFGSTSGNYQIDFSAYDQNGQISTQEINTQTTTGSHPTFTADYSPEPGSEIKVVQNIKIDVRPWSKRNIIYSKVGIIPVAILKTPDFDTKNVDINSVKLGAGQVSPFRNKGYHFDLDRDRDKDLLMFFKISKLGILKKDNQICLKGQTLSGNPFEGCDSIRVIRFKFKKTLTFTQLPNNLRTR